MTASPIQLWRCGRCTVRLAGALEAPGTRHALITQLLATMPIAPGQVQLGHDPWGKPLLLAKGGHPSVSVSFSRHAGWLWAGATQHAGIDQDSAQGIGADIEANIGIDATGPEDFAGPYPDARIFALGELDAAARFVSSLPEARALLWSLKEAAAKAQGTGFHKHEPVAFQVVGLAQTETDFLTCRVHSPRGNLDALTGTAYGFRIASAVQYFQVRNQNG